MKKRILALVLMLAMLMAVAGCGVVNVGSGDKNSDDEIQQGGIDNGTKPDEDGSSQKATEAPAGGNVGGGAGGAGGGGGADTHTHSFTRKVVSSATLASGASCLHPSLYKYSCSECDATTSKELFESGARGAHSYSGNTCSVCKCAKQTELFVRVDQYGSQSDFGDYIKFGSYPQTEVESTAITFALTALAGPGADQKDAEGWVVYPYYKDGELKNYMWYKDVAYEGDIYRGVYFTDVRDTHTEKQTVVSNLMNLNGYTRSKIHWFKFEPIMWKIATEEGGKALLICNMLLDAQEYNSTSENRTVSEKTVLPNDYEHSTIRQWLNDTFYNSAFNSAEQAIVAAGSFEYTKHQSAGLGNYTYGTGSVNDKVTLPSKYDVDTYYANDTQREKKATGYALVQGVNTIDLGNRRQGNWWLRSVYSTSLGTFNIKSSGYVTTGGQFMSSNVPKSMTVTASNMGICPMLWITIE